MAILHTCRANISTFYTVRLTNLSFVFFCFGDEFVERNSNLIFDFLIRLKSSSKHSVITIFTFDGYGAAYDGA